MRTSFFKTFLALSFLLPALSFGQVKVQNLPSGSTPSGGDFAICDQSGVTNKCTYSQVASSVNNLLGLGTFATQNFATPPAIGGTTPAAGAFNSLTDSGVTGLIQCAHFSSVGLLTGTGADCSTGGGTPANPTATIGATAVNGTATTFMRSDAAPALSVSGVTAGTYTNANITVDTTGRVTVAANGSGAGSVSLTASGSNIVLSPSTITGTGTIGITPTPTFTTVNGNALTAGTWTLNGAAGKTLLFNNSLTLAGTDATTFTLPAISGTIDTLNSAQTITAVKTFTNNDICLLGSSTGCTTFASANVGASNFTWTTPAATDTAVGRATTDTLTNKSIAGGEITSAVANATAAVTATNVAGGTANQIPVQTGAGATSYVVAATSGYLHFNGTSFLYDTPSASATSITPGTTTIAGATAPCLIGNSTSTVMVCAPLAPTLAIGSGGAVGTTVPNRTVTTSPTVASTDMGGIIFLNVTGGGTTTIPAISSTVFANQMTLTLTNYSASTAAISTTPTINAGAGCVSGTGIPAGDTWELTSNGTTIDCNQTVNTGGGGTGTVTHTGGALTANAVMLGAGSADSKVVAGIATDGTSALDLGVAGSSVGKVVLANATSGTVTIQPVTGDLGAVTASLPANTGTVAELNLAQTFSAAQTFGSTVTTNITGSTQCVQASTAGLLSGTGSACGSGGSADVQLFTTPGTATWTKPGSGSTTQVMCLGGGGGGASGNVEPSGTEATGAGGGGGGSFIEMNFPTASLGATVTVTVGAGGTGGTAVASTGPGNAGGAGGNSTFGTLLTAWHGGNAPAPATGTASNGGGGGGITAAGNAQFEGDSCGVNGGNAGGGQNPSCIAGGASGGGSSATGGSGNTGGPSLLGGAGGASGGGISTGAIASAGAAGGKAGTSAGGAAGNNPGTAPTNYGAGGGGGGGGGSTTTNGVSGGAGALGAGGGGGGAALNGVGSSGAGGAGGGGMCVAITR